MGGWTSSCANEPPNLEPPQKKITSFDYDSLEKQFHGIEIPMMQRRFLNIQFGNPDDKAYSTFAGVIEPHATDDDLLLVFKKPSVPVHLAALAFLALLRRIEETSNKTVQAEKLLYKAVLSSMTANTHGIYLTSRFRSIPAGSFLSLGDMVVSLAWPRLSGKHQERIQQHALSRNMAHLQLLEQLVMSINEDEEGYVQLSRLARTLEGNRFALIKLASYRREADVPLIAEYLAARWSPEQRTHYGRTMSNLTSTSSSFAIATTMPPPSTLVDFTLVLPLELVLKIFSLLTPLDLSRLSRVCHRWRTFAEDNAVWRKLFSRNCRLRFREAISAAQCESPCRHAIVRVIPPRTSENWKALFATEFVRPFEHRFPALARRWKSQQLAALEAVRRFPAVDLMPPLAVMGVTAENAAAYFAAAAAYCAEQQSVELLLEFLRKYRPNHDAEGRREREKDIEAEAARYGAPEGCRMQRIYAADWRLIGIASAVFAIAESRMHQSNMWDEVLIELCVYYYYTTVDVFDHLVKRYGKEFVRRILRNSECVSQLVKPPSSDMLFAIAQQEHHPFAKLIQIVLEDEGCRDVFSKTVSLSDAEVITKKLRDLPERWHEFLQAMVSAELARTNSVSEIYQ